MYAVIWTSGLQPVIISICLNFFFLNRISNNITVAVDNNYSVYMQSDLIFTAKKRRIKRMNSTRFLWGNKKNLIIFPAKSHSKLNREIEKIKTTMSLVIRNLVEIARYETFSYRRIEVFK